MAAENTYYPKTVAAEARGSSGSCVLFPIAAGGAKTWIYRFGASGTAKSRRHPAWMPPVPYGPAAALGSLPSVALSSAAAVGSISRLAVGHKAINPRLSFKSTLKPDEPDEPYTVTPISKIFQNLS